MRTYSDRATRFRQLSLETKLIVHTCLGPEGRILFGSKRKKGAAAAADDIDAAPAGFATVHGFNHPIRISAQRIGNCDIVEGDEEALAPQFNIRSKQQTR